jgi:Ser/Thr protein kinase RdoA (MazF antagonist)
VAGWTPRLGWVQGRLPGLITEAFGLGRPTSDVLTHTYSSSPTWTLETASGRVLVKQVACAGWRDALDRAMAFERRALQAGIAMPRAIRPVAPVFGCAAEVEGWGLVRAYEWVDGRPLADTDDVAEWLGGTLALLHRIEPLEHAEPQWYGLYPAGQWEAWLAQGLERRRSWAPVLRRRLADVLAATAWITQTFRTAGDYVLTHRDVEPWNVLVTAAGPVLVDWDTAGPDSAGLEAAQAAVAFAGVGRAEPDPGAVRRTLAGYEQDGELRAARGPDALARRAGLRLNRLSGRLRMSLGHQASGPVELVRVDMRAGEQLEELPAFLDTLARWSRLLSALP